MALILKINGTKDYIAAPKVMDGNQPDFVANLKEIVGGNIEFVWVLHDGKHCCMVVNDVGALEPDKYPMNVQASTIYFANFMKTENAPMHYAFRNLAYIHGDVVLLDGVEVK